MWEYIFPVIVMFIVVSFVFLIGFALGSAITDNRNSDYIEELKRINAEAVKDLKGKRD